MVPLPIGVVDLASAVAAVDRANGVDIALLVQVRLRLGAARRVPHDEESTRCGWAKSENSLRVWHLEQGNIKKFRFGTRCLFV